MSDNQNRMDAIDKLLYPSSVAIVGASNNKTKTGGRLLSYLIRNQYPFNIYPVNPKEDVIQGLQCYENIDELPENTDVALVVLPVKMIMATLEECAKKGIKVLVIFSSGFAEIGEEGKRLQENLVKKARELGIYLCGPNGIGVVSTPASFYGSFSMSMETPNIPKKGGISFITQSGAIGGGLLSRVWSDGTGISHFISSGNEADLDTADFIDYLADDSHTEIICVYLEGIKNGAKFVNALKKAYRRGKPVIIYKNGRTSIGKKSVQSHTGSLAGDHSVYEAVFKQNGVISVKNLDELFEVARALLMINQVEGKNVGVISTSGGACTIIADSCIEHGLEVPPFSNGTVERLNEIIPEFGQVQNPFDTTANIINKPENFRKAMEVLQKDTEIDSIVLMLTTVGEPIATSVAQDIISLMKNQDKAIMVIWLISETLASNAFSLLRENGIPVFETPDRAITILNYITNYYLNRNSTTGKGVEIV